MQSGIVVFDSPAMLLDRDDVARLYKDAAENTT